MLQCLDPSTCKKWEQELCNIAAQCELIFGSSVDTRVLHFGVEKLTLTSYGKISLHFHVPKRVDHSKYYAGSWLHCKWRKLCSDPSSAISDRSFKASCNFGFPYKHAAHGILADHANLLPYLRKPINFPIWLGILAARAKALHRALDPHRMST